MRNHKGWIAIPKRPLTEHERSWMNEILCANEEWADVSVGELFAIGKCPCGLCRALQLEPPQRPQNPKAMGHGQVGDIDIRTEAGDTINVALYFRDGYLTDLDVLCEFGFKALPDTWTEVARWVNVE